jgi:hypothetical protein
MNVVQECTHGWSTLPPIELCNEQSVKNAMRVQLNVTSQHAQVMANDARSIYAPIYP